MTENCHQFDALIARAAQLTKEESARLEPHLVGCGACRELARALLPVDDDVAFAATGITANVKPDSAATAPPASHQFEIRTDRYRVTGEVGRGGLGRVLRALDQVLDRPVALKELFSVSDAMRSRFVREALITARLQHPSIVPVYDADHLSDQSPFYAMKLVAGRPLDKSIEEPSTLGQRLALLPTVVAVADAIAYAHNERIIHRDLKPTNILVGKYWDTRTGKLLSSLDGQRGEMVFAMFDWVGMRVVTASTDHTAKVWDAKTGNLLCSLDHADELRLAIFSPDGGRVATIGGNQGARIWNAKTGELIASVAASASSLDQLQSAAFSMDGTRLATVGRPGTARIWNTDNGKLVAELASPENDVTYAAFSSDGERVVTAGLIARVWDARTGKLLASLEGHTGTLYRARFSPDGQRVVTASEDHTAKLWDSRTGKLLASFDGHTDVVVNADFSTDGARVVTASADHTAKLWDARTGKLLASLDGTRIVTTSRDGTIWISDVHLEERDLDTVRRIVGGP